MADVTTASIKGILMANIWVRDRVREETILKATMSQMSSKIFS